VWDSRQTGVENAGYSGWYYLESPSGKAHELNTPTTGQQNVGVHMFWTTFGFLRKAAGVGNQRDSWAEGNFNMFPRGHGYLLYGGYIPDATVYYCPTYTECGPEWISRSPVPDNQAPVMSLNSLTYVRQIGSSLKDWLRGDYTQAFDEGRYLSSYNGTAYAMAWDSTYAYRMQPSWDPGQYDYDMTTENWSRYPHHVPYVKPQIKFENGGSAIFKSQKLLGGRAVMTDHWNRQVLMPEELLDPSNLGAASGHGGGDGYNVLYGDWSARWFGDPQKRVLWWPTGPSTAGHAWFASLEGKECLGVSGNVPGHPMSTSWCAGYPGGFANLAIWHTFDLANSIDVGVEYQREGTIPSFGTLRPPYYVPDRFPDPIAGP